MSNTGNEEIRILKVLFQHKIKLLAITLIVGLVAGIYIKLKPNIYSSTAAISIRQPEVSLTGEIQPLNVETFRSLIESTRMKWELFQELKNRSVLGDDMTFLRFQTRLSTSVEQAKTRDKNLLPMVKLTATTNDPELSMAIANQWAEVVLRQTKKIYRSGVDELGNFTANIYEKVSKSLLESEDHYTETRLESNLSVNKMLLKHNEELFSIISMEILKLGEEVSGKMALLEMLKENLSKQEIDGIWVGELFAREYSENKNYALPVKNGLTDRLVSTIRSLEKMEDILAEFEESSRINYKQMMVKIKKHQIEDISREIMLARTSLSSSEPRYSKLSEELTSLTEKIVLNKAIGDDLLLDMHFKGDLSNVNKIPSLTTEIINPIYQATKKEVVNLAGEIKGLKNQIEEGNRGLESLRKEVSSLDRELVSLEAKRKTLQTALKKDQDLMAYFEKSYNDDRQRYESGEKALVEMKVKLMAKQIERADIEKDIALLEKHVFENESIIARRKRDVDNLTQVRASLAAKAEEVALLRVTMENVSRSGTVILYQAQADPNKVGPNRARTVLMAMLLAFIVSSLVFIVNAVARES